MLANKRIAILYSKASSKTGAALKRAFSDLGARRVLIKRTDKRCNVDAVLRWGSSTRFTNLGRQVELNSSYAVARTTDKLAMLTTLKNRGVPVPEFNTTPDESLKDKYGNFYIRTSGGKVRYGADVTPRDLYYSKPIALKRREYRVHVFNGAIWALYEKTPLSTDTPHPALFNSETCHFRRVDLDRSLCDVTGQQIAIEAVNALGLLFGAVDLVRLKNGTGYVVCEVNSSAGLNGPNVNKFAMLCASYLNERLI